MEKETRWSRRDGNKRSLRPNWNGTQQERERWKRWESRGAHGKQNGRRRRRRRRGMPPEARRPKRVFVSCRSKKKKPRKRRRKRRKRCRGRDGDTELGDLVIKERERERERIYDDFIVLRGLAVGTYSRLFIDATGSPLAFFILFFLFFLRCLEWIGSSLQWLNNGTRWEKWKTTLDIFQCWLW